ncbi:MAG: hypothetical protein M9918_15510 [Anaerolineae bacterium]|nr:hypothetical protein [Anaerolineae bacterium]
MGTEAAIGAGGIIRQVIAVVGERAEVVGAVRAICAGDEDISRQVDDTIGIITIDCPTTGCRVTRKGAVGHCQWGFIVGDRTAAASRCVARKGAVGHRERATVADATTASDVGGIAGDRAVDYRERAGVADAAAGEVRGITGECAPVHRQHTQVFNRPPVTPRVAILQRGLVDGQIACTAHIKDAVGVGTINEVACALYHNRGGDLGQGGAQGDVRAQCNRIQARAVGVGCCDAVGQLGCGGDGCGEGAALRDLWGCTDAVGKYNGVGKQAQAEDTDHRQSFHGRSVPGEFKAFVHG